MTDDAFPNDILKRKKTAEFLTEFIVAECDDNILRENKSFVLNLNGGWGVGKTYFINNWIKLLKVKKHPVVLFNAWKYDYSELPLISFFAEVNHQLEESLPERGKVKVKFSKLFQKGKNILFTSIPAALKHVAIKKLGEEAIDAIDGGDDAESNDLSNLFGKTISEALKNHDNNKNAIEDFIRNFTVFTEYLRGLKSVELPIFIFVDELDRCRPSFAIELLESIKHIFNIPNVCFVVSTHTQQLQHSISSVYGNNFDSEIYLHRFFDSEFILPPPNNFDFAKLLFLIKPLRREVFSPLDRDQCETRDPNIEIFALIAGFYRLSLRDQEQCYKQVYALIHSWANETVHFAFLLFIIMLKKVDRNLFDETRRIGWGNENLGIRSLHISGNSRKINFESEFVQFETQNRGQDSTRSNCRVSEIFKIYLENQEASNSVLQNLGRSNLNWQVNIASEIGNGMPTHWQEGEEPKADLRKYFDLVDQVGFLS